MTTRPLSTKQRNPRRVRMVEAALRLIARGGVISVTHRAVAEEAGVPLASTTYYFDSKSELVEEALRLLIDRSTAFVRQHTAVTEPLTISELVDRIVVFADAQISDPDALLSAQYELMLEAGRSDYLRPLAQRWNVVYIERSWARHARRCPTAAQGHGDHRGLRRRRARRLHELIQRRLHRGVSASPPDRTRGRLVHRERPRSPAARENRLTSPQIGADQLPVALVEVVEQAISGRQHAAVFVAA